jgi:eukaryotic-like serine/threonine-protein kinase
VPSLLGMTLAQAHCALNGASFAGYSSVYGCYGSRNLNQVVKQNPPAGAHATLDTRVQLNLQGGNCPTAVPNVVGLDKTAAISALQQAGFRVDWAYQCLNSLANGDVVTQSPRAGTIYPTSDTVSIQLQASNCPAVVPKVVGLDKTAAISALEQAGFRVDSAYQCLNSSANGNVVTQSPRAGTIYFTGDTVSIYLQASNC